jgi:hypothetical protein
MMQSEFSIFRFQYRPCAADNLQQPPPLGDPPAKAGLGGGLSIRRSHFDEGLLVGGDRTKSELTKSLQCNKLQLCDWEGYGFGEGSP